MSRTFRDYLVSLLDSPDEVYRRHAAHRLASGDFEPGGKYERLSWPGQSDHAPEVRDSLGQAVDDVPRRPPPHWLSAVHTCLYRADSGCGCRKSQCWAGRGDRWPYEPFGLVNLHDCKICLFPKERHLDPRDRTGQRGGGESYGLVSAIDCKDCLSRKQKA